MLDYIFYIIIYLLKICLILHVLEKIEWTFQRYWLATLGTQDTGRNQAKHHQQQQQQQNKTKQTNKLTNKKTKQKQKNKTKIVRVRANGKQFLLPIRHSMLLIYIAKSNKNIVSDKGKKTKFT